MNLFSLISGVLIVYMVLCLVRVCLTWFGKNSLPQARVLIAITNVWLRPFSKIRWLHVRYLDLSPIVALIVLQFLIQVFWRLGIVSQIDGARLTVGWVLFVLIGLIAAAINFFLLFFLILALVRIIGLFITASAVRQFWFTLDHILQPIVYPFITRLSPKRVVPYGTALTIFAAVVGIGNAALQWGLDTLAKAVVTLGT